MPRQSKIEVSAINLRIPADKDRNYTKLLSFLFDKKIAVKVYGNSFIAITDFNKSTGRGAFSKYSEIDIDGDWFDIEDFAPADPEKVDEVSIPDTLRPNLSAFHFKLEADIHVVLFETYSESKALSTRSIDKYFKEVLSDNDVIENYGRVESDIVKSYGEVDRILSLPQLKELRIIIRRPNNDDVSGDLAAQIEDRLTDQDGEEYEEIIRSKNEDGLKPNKRTKKLSIIGAENGEVFGKSIVNGVMITHTTSEIPEKMSDTYMKEEIDTLTMFQRLVTKMTKKIKKKRQKI